MTTTDYIYRNGDDSTRISIFRHDSDGWDAHVFRKGENVECFSSESGETFGTRKEAKEYYESSEGKLKSFNPGNTITKGW